MSRRESVPSTRVPYLNGRPTGGELTELDGLPELFARGFRVAFASCAAGLFLNPLLARAIPSLTPPRSS